ncbi:tetratricopeptide repeat protein [Methylobacterium nodulans]|uniref:Tetratricopeptide TPR_2 repeat protein n=1 Tax=Methylobacterium nodulans (strain LMG 21967 / CNCM I-2342 / ORS 2060) TaxID=460265 RepID=B8IDZ0_METNO|nr:tetratricopeptide repeat protein [Methylobacterium nodulans]ACL57536.1 Tetratricopeptide TPR_2 repeat protein [Methylobacterium nodulans ORS 2060]
MRNLRQAAILIGLLIGLTGCHYADLSGAGAAAPVDDVYVTSTEPDRLGIVQFDRGNYALAERYFRDAVERKQGDIDSWIGLAASYDRLKRFDLADRAYAQALALGGPNASVLNNQGYSLMLRGRFNEAAARFHRAAELDPTNQLIVNNLALLDAVRQKYRR